VPDVRNDGGPMNSRHMVSIYFVCRSRAPAVGEVAYYAGPTAVSTSGDREDAVGFIVSVVNEYPRSRHAWVKSWLALVDCDRGCVELDAQTSTGRLVRPVRRAA